jgi:hypothetical protein
MKQAHARLWVLAMAALVGWAGPATAEEIILKDGQKIVGTIVGYENNMFRLETDYGIALVRKDKVASIQMTKSDDASGKAGAQKPSAMKPSAEKPAPVLTAPEKIPAPQPPAVKPETEKSAPVAPAPQITAPLPAARVVAEKSPAQPAPPPPPPVSRPLDEPLPAHLQEHVEGSNYVNDTFQFSMFKPPDWKIYEGVPGETGSGIMAMGADDEQTLLFVDRQVWSGPPNLTSDLVESRLRQTYQEYRKLSEEPVQCGGLPAIRRTFTGVMDGGEWHGVAVHVVHGNMVFGIIGLTSAETFEFQQAVFGKIIKTFHFLTPAPPAATKGH